MQITVQYLGPLRRLTLLVFLLLAAASAAPKAMTSVLPYDPVSLGAPLDKALAGVDSNLVSSQDRGLEIRSSQSPQQIPTNPLTLYVAPITVPLAAECETHLILMSSWRTASKASVSCIAMSRLVFAAA